MRSILILSVFFLAILSAYAHGGAGGLSDFNGFTVFNEEPDRNVILIVIESTNARHIGPCYGYSRNTSPNICGLAKDGVLFKNAYSQGSSTNLGIPPLITGKKPSEVSLESFKVRMPDDRKTIQEELNSEGYKTFYNTSLSVLDINQDIFDEQGSPGRKAFQEEKVFVFRFFRLLSPHFPYSPPTRYQKWNEPISSEKLQSRGRIEVINGTITHPIVRSLSRSTVKALYDAEIRWVDDRMGDVFERLKKREDYRESMIIVTADHGETFGNRRFAIHSGPPYESVTKVPLVIKFPGNKYAGQVVEEEVGTYAVPATVYDYFDIAPAYSTFARSLIPLLSGQRPGFEPKVVSTDARTWAYWGDRFKYMLKHPEDNCGRFSEISKGKTRAVQELYNLEKDPNETRNVLEENTAKARELHTNLCNIFQEKTGQKQQNDLTEEQKEKLRSLGYLR